MNVNFRLSYGFLAIAILGDYFELLTPAKFLYFFEFYAINATFIMVTWVMVSQSNMTIAC